MSEISSDIKTIHLIRDLEDIIIDLSGYIDSEEINDKLFQAHLKKYNNIAKLLIKCADENDSRLYTLYEAKALFNWIDGDKEQSSDNIKRTCILKGDNKLFSSAGRKLARLYAPKNNIAKTNKAGFLLSFFYLTTILVLIGSCLCSIALLFSLFSIYANIYTLFGAIYFVIIFILSLKYAIMSKKRDRRSISIAVWMFGLLSIGCYVLILFIALAYRTSDGPSSLNFMIFLFILILCAASTIIYYQKSQSVKSYFTE